MTCQDIPCDASEHLAELRQLVYDPVARRPGTEGAERLYLLTTLAPKDAEGAWTGLVYARAHRGPELIPPSHAAHVGRGHLG